ncbi:MAG: ATP-binding protein [bacterium]
MGECIDEVLTASYRARDLVSSILSFNRGDLQERIPVQVQDIVDETLSLLRASWPATVEIETHFVSECGAVLAEPTQIHQVIMNLCTNAAQAMEQQGGRLDIALDEVNLGADDTGAEPVEKAGRYVRLTVSDTGPGIDPQISERIFDPYFTTKPTGKGSGMGLAVVHGIVANNGGTITVENEPGSGAVFRIYLPRIDPEDRPQSSAAATRLTGDERILFVDDEPSLARLNQKHLERFGYTVTAVTSSRNALNIFRSDPEAFDLVITDQTMPEMTGDQLTTALLAIRSDLPVILCTGYSETVNEETASELGIRAFVMKPFKREELMTAIREVIEGQPSVVQG